MPRDEKLRLLDAGLKAYLSPLAMNLVRLLEQRGKVALAREIQVAFQAMLDDRRGVAHAVVTTAVPLADDERAAVAAKLSAMTGKQVDVMSVVDASIIGGIVARIGDQLVDGSTRSRLAALKRSLEGRDEVGQHSPSYVARTFSPRAGWWTNRSEQRRDRSSDLSARAG